MGSYLIKAPDEDLLAWKQAAKDEGLTLAAWIRRRLNGEPDLVGVAQPVERDLAKVEGAGSIPASHSVTEAEVAEAPGCDPEDSGFESHPSPSEETLGQRLARLTADRPERTFKPDPKPSSSKKGRR